MVPAASATIVIGQGIDGVKLGEAQAPVQQQLGTPAYKEETNGETIWGFPTTFEGRISFDATQHVSGMWTISKKQKTNKGIGPGLSRRRAAQNLPEGQMRHWPVRA